MTALLGRPRQGTPGHADWGNWRQARNAAGEPIDVCLSCGRPWGGHAGTGCFSPDSTGLAEREPGQECPNAPGVWCGSHACLDVGCIATETSDGQQVMDL